MTDILNAVVKPGTFYGTSFELRRRLTESAIPEDMIARKIVERTSNSRPASQRGTIDLWLQVSIDGGASWVDAVEFGGAHEVHIATSLKAPVAPRTDNLTHATWWRAKYVADGDFDNTSISRRPDRLRVVQVGEQHDRRSQDDPRGIARETRRTIQARDRDRGGVHSGSLSARSPATPSRRKRSPVLTRKRCGSDWK